MARLRIGDDCPTEGIHDTAPNEANHAMNQIRVYHTSAKRTTPKLSAKRRSVIAVLCGERRYADSLGCTVMASQSGHLNARRNERFSLNMCE